MESPPLPVTPGVPWPPAHVLAMAPDARSAGAARRIAVPGDWTALGADDAAVWGLYCGSGAEPYQVMVALDEPAFGCSCPSRQRPCKHGLALLLLWSAGHLGDHRRPAVVHEWLARRAVAPAAAGTGAGDAARGARPTAPGVAGASRASGDAGAGPDAAGGGAGAPAGPQRPSSGSRPELAPPEPPTGRDERAAERAQRVAHGLAELDRWLHDVVRTGLTAPALTRYATWDAVAARLVDAQAGALANRVRRLAGVVGTRPAWHEYVLAELASLHLLCAAGQRLALLEPELAASVRTALGFTVRQADVMAGPPETDRWFVCGRSDTLEDRIVVRRLWLWGLSTRRWALGLSFAAYGTAVDERYTVGQVLRGDLHRYPGRRELRCVVGALEAETVSAPEALPVLPRSTSLAGACDEAGAALADVPWLERWPVTVDAAPTLADGRWVLADHTGSLPLVAGPEGLAPLVASSRGGSVVATCEWTGAGLVPLAVHLGDRSVDLGPRGGFHERRSRAS